jgi:hypothetical protein
VLPTSGSVNAIFEQRSPLATVGIQTFKHSPLVPADALPIFAKQNLHVIQHQYPVHDA